MTVKPRIAHFAGPNATIQNSPPLVTSNKAREKYGLPPIANPDGTLARFDVLRPQRLAAPVTVYVEQFSAHPLERDAARIERNLKHAPLAGFVVEGLSPYGIMTSTPRHRLMLRALHSGMPVVRVGRGNNDGFVPPRDRLIGGRNLTATKARLLLLACLMRFGALPPAADPDRPTPAEIAAIREKLAAYQAVFDTH
jgi:L-asparaginase